MSKKTFMAAIISILLALMLNGALLVNITKANPIPNEQISPPPIIIQSPLNTTYDQNDIPLNFTVVGASEYYPMTYKLSYIYYVCDGEFHDYSLGINLERDQYCTNLTGLSKGQHTLTVHAEGVGSYYITSTQWTQYTISSVQTVAFTVTKNLPTLVVTINSPLNQTYTTDSVKVNVSAYDISKAIIGMSYVMDIYYEPYWVGSVTFYTNEPKFVSDGVSFSHEGNGTTTMTNLVNGQHHMILTITEWMMGYSDTTYDIYFTVQKPTQEPTSSPEISPTPSPTLSPTPTESLSPSPTSSQFTVDTKHPRISLLLQNRTYNQLSLPLDVLIDQPASWIGYSLDNEANVTIKGNTTTLNLTVGGTTLSDLTVGTHNLTVYANDSSGNMGKSDTVSFTVNTQSSPTPSPSPTQQPTTEQSITDNPTPNKETGNASLTLEIAGIVVIALVVVGLLVLFSKRRGKKQ